jgi:hypothetical protein
VVSRKLLERTGNTEAKFLLYKVRNLKRFNGHSKKINKKKGLSSTYNTFFKSNALTNLLTNS